MYIRLRALFCLAAGSLVAIFPTFSIAETAPVIVTATRVAQTADRSLSSVTVIAREEIQRSGTIDVADILRFHAGLDIGRNGGPGQQTSLFMRGTDSNHTLVLLDGVRINPGTIGGAPLQYINPEIIERIEVVRGPHSTLYGSDAIGGVIQIFTRKPEKDLAVSAGVGTGANSTNETDIMVSGSSGPVSTGIQVGYQTTNGFPTRTTSTIESGHDNTTVNAHLAVDTAAAGYRLSHWQARGITEYLDFFLVPLSQDFTNTVTSVAIEPALNGNWIPTLKFSHTEDDIQQRDNNDFVRTRRNILDWQNDIQVSNSQLVTAGLYLLREKTDSLSFGTAFDEDTDVNAVFIQDQLDINDHQLRLSARYTDHEGFGNETTWGIAYGYQLPANMNLFASAGSGFRAPDATDRFGFGGNPALLPEESLNFEIGVRKRLGKTHELSATVFQNEIDELIVFNDPDGFLGPLPGMNENIEEARIRGVELGYRVKSGNITGRIEAIIQDPENRTLNKQLARRAERTLTTRVDYDAGKYRTGLEFIATSDRPDSDFNTTRLGGYGLVNLDVTIPLGKNITIDGKLENALDKQYELADGFAAQDRAVFMMLHLRD